MQHSNDTKKNYKATRESIKHTFPEAYNFLIQIEKLSDRGFKVGTGRNLHLYYKSSFFFYFYFSKDSSRIVGIWSKFNVQIKRGTINNSDYFFNFLIPKLSNFDNTNNTLEIDNQNGFKITINQTDKSTLFFKILLDSLLELSNDQNLSLTDYPINSRNNNSDKREYQISQTWQILIEHALKNSFVSYGEIGKTVGVNPRQVGIFLLKPILIFCIDNRLPYITTITIRKGLKRANFEEGINEILQQLGQTTIPIESENEEIKKVHSFNWRVIKNPFQNIHDTTDQNEQEELEQIYQNKSKVEILKELENLQETDPVEITINHKTYKRDNKTVAQIKILRDFKCQICSTTILKKDGSKYIEAAHIKAKHKKGRETLDNILLLCPNHHKEFDYGERKILNHIKSEIEFVLNGNRHKIPLTVNTDNNNE